MLIGNEAYVNHNSPGSGVTFESSRRPSCVNKTVFPLLALRLHGKIRRYRTKWSNFNEWVIPSSPQRHINSKLMTSELGERLPSMTYCHSFCRRWPKPALRCVAFILQKEEKADIFNPKKWMACKKQASKQLLPWGWSETLSWWKWLFYRRCDSMGPSVLFKSTAEYNLN